MQLIDDRGKVRNSGIDKSLHEKWGNRDKNNTNTLYLYNVHAAYVTKELVPVTSKSEARVQFSSGNERERERDQMRTWNEIDG